MTESTWMPAALALAFDHLSGQETREILRTPDRTPEVWDMLARNGVRVPANPDSRQDHLLQGILALRLKFSREDAERKLAANLAMREQRAL